MGKCPKKELSQATKYEENSMLVKKSQFISKLIALLMSIQIILLGIQANNRIQDGESQIEVLLWMLSNCTSILKQVKKDDDD